MFVDSSVNKSIHRSKWHRTLKWIEQNHFQSKPQVLSPRLGSPTECFSPTAVTAVTAATAAVAAATADAAATASGGGSGR